MNTISSQIPPQIQKNIELQSNIKPIIDIKEEVKKLLTSTNKDESLNTLITQIKDKTSDTKSSSLFYNHVSEREETLFNIINELDNSASIDKNTIKSLVEKLQREADSNKSKWFKAYAIEEDEIIATDIVNAQAQHNISSSTTFKDIDKSDLQKNPAIATLIKQKAQQNNQKATVQLGTTNQPQNNLNAGNAQGIKFTNVNNDGGGDCGVYALQQCLGATTETVQETRKKIAEKNLNFFTIADYNWTVVKSDKQPEMKDFQDNNFIIYDNKLNYIEKNKMQHIDISDKMTSFNNNDWLKKLSEDDQKKYVKLSSQDKLKRFIGTNPDLITKFNDLYLISNHNILTKVREAYSNIFNNNITYLKDYFMKQTNTQDHIDYINTLQNFNAIDPFILRSISPLPVDTNEMFANANADTKANYSNYINTKSKWLNSDDIIAYMIGNNYTLSNNLVENQANIAILEFTNINDNTKVYIANNTKRNDAMNGKYVQGSHWFQVKPE